MARAGLAAAMALSLVAAAAAVTGAATVNPSGPLTAIEVTPDLNCAVDYAGDALGQFYEDTACATLVAVDDTLFGPDFIPGNFLSRTTFTPVSQSPWTGTGTTADPYTLTTVVDLGATGVRLTQVDSYRDGENAYRTSVRLTNSSGIAKNAILYRAADCYLQDSDDGYGLVGSPDGAIACTNQSPFTDGRVEQFLPLTPGSHYLEDLFSEVWSAVATRTQLPDTCRCGDLIDNAMALSWPVALPANGSAPDIAALATFSPIGRLPLITTISATPPTVAPGATTALNIQIANPNAVAVPLDSIVATLPAGFSYRTGSTAGATTSDPDIDGPTLTWTGPLPPVPSGGTSTLSFSATAGATAGTFSIGAGASALGYTVVPATDSASVTGGGPTIAPGPPETDPPAPAPNPSQGGGTAGSNDPNPNTNPNLAQPLPGMNPTRTATAVCQVGRTCTVTPPAGPDSAFRIDAGGGNQRAVLFATLNGTYGEASAGESRRRMRERPDCPGYRELNSDWVQFGFLRPAKGATWDKTGTLTTRKVQSKKAARALLARMQVCFAAPYEFVPREGYRMGRNGSAFAAVLPDCGARLKRQAAQRNLAMPCLQSRSLVAASGGWVVRLLFRVPANGQDPKALG